jgi:beta-RFAP synthase
MVENKVFNQIKVESNSRLHLGFINLNSTSPYSYGGLGLSISNFPTIISISRAKKFESNLPSNISKTIHNYLKKNKLSHLVKIDCISKPESHIGLGSGTQLILSLQELISKYYKLDQDVDLFKRNFRSGVGYNTYKHGGIILDAPKNDLSSSQVIFKSKLPSSWKIILLFDKSKKGIHGKSESKFFTSTNSDTLRKTLSDIALNELIPSIINHEFSIFASSLTKFQKLNARFYSSIQKSIYLSTEIDKVISHISKFFTVGSGQSSWGPTSYMFIDPKDDINEILPILDKTISMYNNVSYSIVSAKNNRRKLTYI